MMAFIPLAFIFTLTVIYAVSVTDRSGEVDMPQTVRSNMLMQHGAALTMARSEEMTSGDLSGMLGASFRDLGDWQSRIYEESESGLVVLATWPGEEPKVDDTDLVAALGGITDAHLRTFLNSYAGLYEYTDVGARVGRLTMETTLIPIPDGTPVIISQITE